MFAKSFSRRGSPPPDGCPSMQKICARYENVNTVSFYELPCPFQHFLFGSREFFFIDFSLGRPDQLVRSFLRHKIDNGQDAHDRSRAPGRSVLGPSYTMDAGESDNDKASHDKSFHGMLLSELG